MDIGLIDVDGHNFSNLVPMKSSVWHKLQDDTVLWHLGIEYYDRVYMSKVFSFSPDDGRVIQADEAMKGGSGYKLFNQWLPDEIEHIYPGYSLYPMHKEIYGFLTCGYINKRPFCTVPCKEGLTRKNANITEFLDGRNSVILMDNNIIASKWGLQQIERIINPKVKVDLDQGIDYLITVKDKLVATLLVRVPWIRYVRMVYDNSATAEEVETVVAYLKEAGI